MIESGGPLQRVAPPCLAGIPTPAPEVFVPAETAASDWTTQRGPAMIAAKLLLASCALLLAFSVLLLRRAGKSILLGRLIEAGSGQIGSNPYDRLRICSHYRASLIVLLYARTGCDWTELIVLGSIVWLFAISLSTEAISLANAIGFPSFAWAWGAGLVVLVTLNASFRVRPTAQASPWLIIRLLSGLRFY